MPYYKRRYRKPRKYFKKYSKKHRMLNPKGKAYFKLRITATVASNGAGIISFAYSNDPSGFRDWSSVAALYDEYVVKGMSFKFIPFLPNDTSTVTGYLPFYSVVDQNSATTPLSSINSAIEYENMKVFNMFRPWKLYRRYNKITGNGSTIVNNGYTPTADPTATACCAFYGEGFDVSTSYGSIIVTAYITARGRK